jgi:crotonobetainyl-CoA:carnitine CoA-transferase CaiB-like acyl-CoA transferase
MLAGVRILDLTWVLGGPFASYLLAQLGAEIIKVEPPSGDLARSFPPHFFEGDSAFFLSINRGKKSIALDLKHPQGRQAFYDLARKADAVMYGFAPDVPAKLGLDFDTLHAINPKLCVAELIGFHDQGEYATKPSFDIIAQAMGGFMDLTGEPGGKPVRGGYQIADLGAGLYLALGLLAALFEARGSGVGKKIQTTLLDCQLALLTWQAQNYFVTGEVPRATGSRHATLAPSEAFLCADGKYIVVSASTQAHWPLLCKAIGRPELADDARFADPSARITNVDALAETLGAVLRQQPASHWVERIGQAGVPVGPVNNVAEALAQPLAGLRNMIEPLANPRSGAPLNFLGNPIKFGQAPNLAYPPACGAHTREVLRDVCGYDAARIEQLERAGAVKASA